MGRLQGLRILIVEDDFFIAEDLAFALAEEGAVIEGPVGSLAEAMDLATRATHLDHAVLDVTLRREKIYHVAEILCRRAVPVTFLTGEPDGLPAGFDGVPVFGKPAAMGAIIDHLARARLQSSSSRARSSAPSSGLPAGGMTGNRPSTSGA